MAESKHTAGPWTVEQPGQVRQINTAAHGEPGISRTIALICERRVKGSGCQAEETDANARLIAAAPELLKALKALWVEVAKYDSIGHEGSNLLEVMSDARVAIAKAEGR